MKSNNFLRAAAYLLMMVVVSLSLLSGALGKYIAAATAGASARVAKFQVKVNSKEISETAGVVTKEVPVSLVNSYLLQPFTDGTYNMNANHSYGPANPATILYRDGSIIAPGTGGRIVVVFENLSEVTVRFSFDEAATHSKTVAESDVTIATTHPADTADPLCEIQFSRPSGSVIGGTPASGAGYWGDMNRMFSYSRTWYNVVLGPAGSGTSTHTMYIYWRWRFNNYGMTGASWNRDTQDTALGIAAAAAAYDEKDDEKRPAFNLVLVFKAVQVN